MPLGPPVMLKELGSVLADPWVHQNLIPSKFAANLLWIHKIKTGNKTVFALFILWF